MARKLPNEPLMPHIVSQMLKLLAGLIFGFFMFGIIAGVLGFLPFYQVIFEPVMTFLWRFAIMIGCLIGVTALAGSVR